MQRFYRELKDILTSGTIPEGEASAIALMLLEEVAGLTKMQVLTGTMPEGSHTDALLDTLRSMARRISMYEPVQYVLGYEWFRGMRFKVTPDVLIPRPETGELVDWAIEASADRILDIGTGSGCIAISLAKALPAAQVTALDISHAALSIAQENAIANSTTVDFLHCDILTDPIPLQSSFGVFGSDSTPLPYDLIISNPPYICDSEASDMSPNVLDHEPHTALFVPDADPLLFYRTIARKALTALAPHGILMFEINRAYGDETVQLLRDFGYTDIQLRQDSFGNPRMIRSKAPS